MALTVPSILITTPLRRPREGLVPIPTISSPSSVMAPTIAQILVVPISSPTIRFSLLLFILPPIVRTSAEGPCHIDLDNDPLDNVQIDISQRRKARLQIVIDPLQPLQLVQIVVMADPDRHAANQGVEGQPLVGIDMHLRDLLQAEHFPTAQQLKQTEGLAETGPDLLRMIEHVIAVDPTDDREIELV